MAGQHSSATRWHLAEPLELGWRFDALCLHRQDLPWTPDTEPDYTSLIEMKVLCAECPVAARCAEFGLTQPGGFYAGVWTPWKDGAASEEGECDERGQRYSAREALRRVRDSATQVLLPLSFSSNTPRSKDARELSVAKKGRPVSVQRRGGAPVRRKSRDPVANPAPAAHARGSRGAARAAAESRRRAALP